MRALKQQLNQSLGATDGSALRHGGGFGHTGFVERVDDGMLTTLEGNTDASKTREGAASIA